MDSQNGNIAWQFKDLKYSSFKKGEVAPEEAFLS